MSDFTAQYQPMRSEGQSDPSRSGFATEDAAWEYVFDQICGTCKNERRIALLGEEHPEYKAYIEEGHFQPSEYPACTCEWLVFPTEFTNAPHEEKMAAAGWKPVEFFDILKDAEEAPE